MNIGKGPYPYLAIVILLALLPPLAIRSADTGMRIGWYVFLASALIPLAISAFFVPMSGPHYSPKGMANFRFFGFLMLAAFCGGVLGSIEILNEIQNSPVLASVADRLSKAVELLWPALQNFEISLSNAEAQLQFSKLRSVSAVWFVFGFVCVACYAAMVVLFSPSDRRIMRTNAVGSRSEGFQALAGFFGLLISVATWFGWVVDSNPNKERDCLFSVPCVVKDDLMILVFAGTQMLSLFGFGLGGILLLHRAFSRLEHNW